MDKGIEKLFNFGKGVDKLKEKQANYLQSIKDILYENDIEF